MRRRSVLLSKEKPKVIVQDYAVDQFGELRDRKKKAAASARALGHDLTGWHRRPSDSAGRWNAFCATCNRLAVACTETPVGFNDVYGTALTESCNPLEIKDL